MAEITNKYQEALDFITDCIEFNYKTIKDLEAIEFYCDMVQELVDKETPIKPKHLVGNRYSCDNCAMSFVVPTRRFVSNQYCDVCGHKFDWSDEE